MGLFSRGQSHLVAATDVESQELSAAATLPVAEVADPAASAPSASASAPSASTKGPQQTAATTAATTTTTLAAADPEAGAVAGEAVLPVVEAPPAESDDGAEPETLETLDEGEKRKLKRLESMVTFMDSGFRVPLVGYRFGMDAIIGVVPYAGDAMGALVGTYIMSCALRYHLPKRLVMRMACNQAIDACAGVVPFLGDVFDVGFKANRRNLLLLQAHLKKPREAKRADGCFLFSVFFVVVVLPFLAVIAIVAAIIVAILAAFGKIG